MSIRILLVDDHAVVRHGLRMFLELDAEFEIVGEASNGARAVELTRELRPDVVLMDLLMPVMDGIAATAAIRKEAPDTEVIALTSVLEDDKVIGAIRAGAIWAIPFCARATAEMRPHQFEYRMVAADGRIVWLRDNVTVVVEDGQPAELRGVMVDITEKKQAEAALLEKEEQYRSIFESTSDGVIINDIETGIVVAANPACCRMHGYEAEEFIGLHPTAFIHPDDHWQFVDYIREIRSEGESRRRARDVRKDGSVFHVEVYGRRFVYRGGPHVLGVVRDVSQQVQAEQLLEQRVAERTRELRALLEISENVASTLELKPLLEVILAQLKGLIDYSAAAILVVQGDELSVVGAQEPLANDTAEPFRWPVSALGSFWDTLSRGVAIAFPDVHGDVPLAAEFRGVAGQWLESRRSFVRSCLWVPLVVKDRIIGLLIITHGDANHFTSHDVNLATAVARHAAIAIENARLFTEVQGKAALEERQRLARELHDSVSQALYGIVLGTETARKLLEREPARAAAPLEYVHSLAEAGLAEMRALIFELRPESLETEGLVVALVKQADALRARHQLVIETDLGEEPAIPLYVKEALYRIAQEALHNVVKHAEATRVSVRLERDAEQVVLEVHDDGVGFDTSAEFPGHLGLRSMRERTTHLGGSIDVASTRGRGTTIRVCVPYRDA